MYSLEVLVNGIFLRNEIEGEEKRGACRQGPDIITKVNPLRDLYHLDLILQSFKG